MSNGAVNLAKLADLKIGVVPVINLEWTQKIHRDRASRGYSTEAVTDVILRRMHAYVHCICPQFTETDINFQRVPVVDTSNPFIARWIPTADESVVVIRFRNPRGIDFPYLVSMIQGSLDEPGELDRDPGQQARPRDAADPDAADPAARRHQETVLEGRRCMNRQVTLASEATMANAVRALAMDAVEAAKSGHPGMPMGMADVAAVLFNRFIKLDPADPKWPDRDRFVLSAGHGSMLLYALNHLLGYADMGVDQLKAFRQLGSRTAGHPEYGHALGVEVTTGPLGQGIATAVGMALAERMQAARFPGLADHFTWVIAGDGCLMEGVSQEAIDLAGHLRLGRLVVLWDDNRITIDGDVGLSTSIDQAMRFRASGWRVLEVDGHDHDRVAAAIAVARELGPADDDRLPDGDRLRRADEAGRARRARRAARRRRDRGGARAARLEPCAVRDSRGCVCRLREGCRPWGEREGGLGGAAELLPSPRRLLVRAGRRGAGARRGDGRLQGRAAARPAEGRDAQGERDGARGGQRGGAVHGRRVGRPDGVEPDQVEGHAGGDARRLRRVTTSTTASASTAWRRR